MYTILNMLASCRVASKVTSVKLAVTGNLRRFVRAEVFHNLYGMKKS